MSKSKLMLLIEENQGYITSKKAKEKGIHPMYLSMLLESDEIVKTNRGVYQKHNVFDDTLFNYQAGKSKMIYSHFTALFLHQLSDRDPEHPMVTVPSGYHTSTLRKNGLEVYTIQNRLFELGKIKIKTMFGNEIDVYNVERSICDIVRSRNKLDQDLMYQVIKNYIQSHSKDLNRLMNYAKEFHVDNVIKTILGPLL